MICFLFESINWEIKYFVKLNFFMLVFNIVIILLGFIDLIKFKYELFFKNFGENFVKGLNSNDFLLLINCVFKCGIDIGGVLILVLL